MRQAPPVGVTCSGGGAWRLAQAVLASAAGAALGAWAALLSGAGPMVALLAASCGGAAAAAAMWRAQAPAPAELRWDGAAWSVEGAVGEVRTMLDLGGWMLLRFKPATTGAARWLALPAAEAGPAWHGLRAALYSPAASPPPGPSPRLPD